MRLWWQALKINVVLGRQCPRLSSATRNLAFHWKAGSKGYAGHHKFNVFLHAFVLSLPLSPKVFWQEDSRSLALDLSPELSMGGKKRQQPVKHTYQKPELSLYSASVCSNKEGL